MKVFLLFLGMAVIVAIAEVADLSGWSAATLGYGWGVAAFVTLFR